MQTLVHADIFFFITAITVVALGVVLAVAGIYLILILRELRRIFEIGKRETELLAEDVNELRDTIRKEGAEAKHMFDFVFKVFKKNKRKRK